MEFIIALVIIVLTLLYFLFFKGEKKQETSKPKKVEQKPQIKQEKKEQTVVRPKEVIVEKVQESVQHVPKIIEEDNSDKNVNLKEHMKYSFREVKDLRNPYISPNGKTILFSDEKRILIGFINNFNEKNIKFTSKSIEQDVITDISYSEEKKQIVVGLKNSKELIFFQIEKDENNKNKLVKLDRKIKTDRKFEIKHVAFSKDGHFVSTTGTGQDTTVQIYSAVKSSLIETLDTNEIQNAEIKMTQDDKYLTISTFMYEIAVIEFKKSFKFNKAINGDELILKVK